MNWSKGLKEAEAKLKQFESFIDEFNHMKKELEFYKSGGVVIATLSKLSPEELQELISLAKKMKGENDRGA